ncbi:MAG: immunoglobulin-like domain-containing protein [bacterium]
MRTYFKKPLIYILAMMMVIPTTFVTGFSKAEKAMASVTDGVWINEFVANSNNPSSDWAELYNSNNSDFSLNGWSMKDSTSTMKTFAVSDKIPAKGFLIVDLSNRLDAASDEIHLVDSSALDSDFVKYGIVSLAAPVAGESAHRVIDGGSAWVIDSSITKGYSNDVTPPAQPVINPVVSPVNADTQVISGTTEAFATVTINSGSGPYSQATDVTGAFAITVGLNQDAVNAFGLIAKDLAGNSTNTAFFSIREDSTAPTIHLVGSPDVTIEKGSVYTDLGATSVNNIDGNLTGQIVVVNPVDVNTVGDYTVTYNVKDAAGNAATEVTRTVHVVNTLLLGAVAAQDFGVVDYATGLGQLKGYTAGFGLTDATFDTAQSIVVKLYGASDQLLQTNTVIMTKINTLIGATAISSPFDVSGNFDYVTDGYWTNARETEYGQNIPAVKVVITVTLANTKEVTAENINLVGDPSTITLLGAVAAQDFGVVNYDTGLGQLKGYTAGFGLTAATFDTAKSTVIKLYAANGQLLQTNTATPKLATLIGATDISSPFDVSGNFNYVTDGYWTNARETEYGQNIPAVKVVITVTLANGKIVTAENTNLVGDPATILNVTPPEIIVTAPSYSVSAVDKTIRVNWTGTGAEQYKIVINGPSGYVDIIQANSGNDLNFNYTKQYMLDNYGTYTVSVSAIKGGKLSKSTGSQTIILSAPVVTTPAPEPTPESTPSYSVAPHSVKAAGPAVAATPVPSDDDGKIKAAEETAPGAEEDDVNWTPWIVLFILIMLAGAATGGYFCWFNKAEVVTVVKKSSKAVVKTKAKVTPKKIEPSSKKAKRW